MTDNKNAGNYNDTQPFVVGILSPSTTLYIDQMPNNREILPPSDLNLQRRNTNSFQITSVTVQGSRKNDDFADDSADDLDESHTDDLSSDILDSSRADFEGYHSEDSNQIGDDLSPCGPIIFAQLPSRDPNMNLSLGVTPTFTAISPNVVAGGVTMMTSKSESPISAQVPIMNPLPDNWQRRFKVVKIVSSEPFSRGRWLCMDFKDPPESVPCELRNGNNGTSTPPTIQITHCDSDGNELLGAGDFAQVYEIPINQTFSGNFIMGNQQQMYGIILPQSEHLQPVTLVQDMSLQKTVPLDKNSNNIVNNHSIQVEPVGKIRPHETVLQPAKSLRHVQTILNNGNFSQSPPSSLSANNNYNNNVSEAVPNHVNNSTGRDNSDNVTEDNPNINRSENAVPAPATEISTENSESFSSLANELSRASGLLRQNPLMNFGYDISYSPPLQPRIFPPIQPVIFPTEDATENDYAPISAPHPTVPALSNSSSQTAPEKIAPSEVGHDVDPSSGSAASTGGNTVAIDNKIEQAMDLVKSHLMFAVREEVEVLKEKITELLERISQLEHENDILRANASAETLKQLNNQKKNTAGGTAGKPQSVASVPPST